jgi:hypothetical protein
MHDDIAEALAPPAPPCFSSRLHWVSYVRTAADWQRPQHSRGPLVFGPHVIEIRTDAGLNTAERKPNEPPLLIEKGRAVTFNPRFDYCSECKPEWRAEKQRRGLCRPTYLKDLLTTTKDPA